MSADSHILLRIYLESADRAPHTPTVDRLIQAARASGLGGATVLRGILGFGPGGTARESTFAIVEHVPVILEIVDVPEKIAAFADGTMAELMGHGLATIERATVIMQRASKNAEYSPLEIPRSLAARSTFPDLRLRGPMSAQNGILLRIFIGESDRLEHQPLYEAIVQKARALGLAGATVLRGSEGFGANSVVHKASLLEMSTDLPIVIEIVDSREKIEKLLPDLHAMVKEGMITMEEVEILLYRRATTG